MIIITLCLGAITASSQRFQAGVTFQYIVLKQVHIDADYILPKESYNFYYTSNQGYKLFSGGQSIVIGTSLQYNIRKFYIGTEPSFELNTYNYKLHYPLAPGKDDEVAFQTLFYQVEAPLYVGYQFKTSNVIRFSVFAGAMPVLPYHLEFDFRENEVPDGGVSNYDNYWVRDLNGILYNNKGYWNGIAGIGVHFASLLKLDLRFTHRLSSPGDQYNVTFTSAGFALTYYLPFDILKQKVYYEK